MHKIKYVKRDGFPRVRKTPFDLPTDCLGYEDNGIYSSIVLYIRDDPKTRPLLGIRRADIVMGKTGRPWYRWWEHEEIYPVSISECRAILDGSLIPAGYDKKNDCFTRWEGDLLDGSKSRGHADFVYRRLERKIKS